MGVILPKYYTDLPHLKSYCDSMEYEFEPNIFDSLLKEKKRIVNYQGSGYNEDGSFEYNIRISGVIDVIKYYPDGNIYYGISDGNHRVFI